MTQSYHTYSASGGGSGSIYFGDAVLTAANLPASGVNGEIRLAIDTKVLYEYSTVSSTWTAINVLPSSIGAASGICPLGSDSLVPINYLPPAALERLVVVADQAARYALTTATVQNGDTVKQTDTGEMWLVKDQDNLNNSNGYAVYSAGTASAVPWSGITTKPTTVSGFGITDAVSPATLTSLTSDDSVFWNGSAWVNRQQYSSAGCITTPTYVDNGDGSITVNQVTVSLWDNAVFTGQPKKYILAQITATLTDGVFNYVVGDYNGGSPILRVITNVALITESDIIPVASVFRSGTSLDVLTWDTLAKGLPNKLHQSVVKTQRFRRESGLGISEYGSRNVDVLGGTVWVGGNKVLLDEVATATDNMILYYRNGASWSTSTVTQYTNNQYDTGSGLGTIDNAKYATSWIYRGICSSKHLYMVLGTDASASLINAQAAQPPTLPAAISSTSMLVGRIITLKGASTATQIDSAFAVTFAASGVLNHNDLSNIQGGSTTERYHLTAAQATVATQAASTSLDGYLSSTNWNSFNNRQPYHGFENRTASTLVWTNTTPDRTLTLTGTFSYYYQGTKITIAATSPAVQITNTVGLWYIYFASNGTLTASQSFPAFATTVIVATVFWNGSTGAVCDERHGYGRNLDWHSWAHNTIGTRYGSGHDLTTASSGGTATFSVSTGTIYDEDIAFSTASPTTSCRIFYQTGATTYAMQTAVSTTPFLWNSSTTRVRYVDAASSYALTDANSARFVNVWVYLSTDINYPVYMFVETIATATGGASSAANARLVNPPSLSGFGLMPELKLAYRLVVKGDGVIQTAVAADDYRLTSPLPSGGVAATTAAAVSFAPYDGITSVTVQTAIAELADKRVVKLTADTKTTHFTVAADYLYLVTASAAVNIQLPTPVLGLTFKIKDVGGNFSQYAINLVRAGSEKIEGTAASYLLDSDYGCYEFWSNGTDWYRV